MEGWVPEHNVEDNRDISEATSGMDMTGRTSHESKEFTDIVLTHLAYKLPEPLDRLVVWFEAIILDAILHRRSAIRLTAPAYTVCLPLHGQQTKAHDRAG
jgi:hypothetical protein